MTISANVAPPDDEALGIPKDMVFKGEDQTRFLLGIVSMRNAVRDARSAEYVSLVIGTLTFILAFSALETVWGKNPQRS